MESCSNCGTELGESARFCSGCGVAVSSSLPAPRRDRDWDLHVNVLGWLLIGCAVLQGVIGFLIMAAGGLAQNVLQRTPRLLPPDIPVEVIDVIAPAAFLIGLLVIALASPIAAAGVGLLRYRRWGRVLALVVSVLIALKLFPLGVALTVYAFWVLNSRSGKRFYDGQAAAMEARV